MDFYEDYQGFKNDNEVLINDLVKTKSPIIARFKHVFAVVDYLYAKHKDLKDNESDEDLIFQTGYSYVFDRFNTIDLIYTKIFDKNFNEMNKYAKTINLLLYTIDFQDEIKSIDENNTTEYNSLVAFEDLILKKLEGKEHADDIFFGMLNDISTKAFSNLDVEYYGLNEIFYDIALELEIIDEIDDEGIDVLL